MKIGIDARAAWRYRGTGIGTYSYQLISNLNVMDKLNDYLVFMPDDTISSIPFGNNFDIQVISSEKNENFWKEVDIPNLLTNTKIDLYHVPQNGIGLPTEKKCPFAITLHDIIPYKIPETVGPQYLEIYLKEIPKILPLCDGIITVSNFSKKDISKTLNYPEEKIYVTYLAAEDIYSPKNKKMCKTFIKNKYAVCDDFILYVGGLSPRKNIKGLIESFNVLKSKYKKTIKLVILGKKGRSYYDYRDLAYSLSLKDDVYFLGQVPIEDLPVFYNAASLFCYPSMYEGFGLPPIEAMACGTPCITSNSTSIPEIVGDGAITCEPNDIDDIADKMLTLLENEKLYREMSIKGLEKSSSFSWKKTAVETMSIYEKISKAK